MVSLLHVRDRAPQRDDERNRESVEEEVVLLPSQQFETSHQQPPSSLAGEEEINSYESERRLERGRVADKQSLTITQGGQGMIRQRKR